MSNCYRPFAVAAAEPGVSFPSAGCPAAAAAPVGCRRDCVGGGSLLKKKKKTTRPLGLVKTNTRGKIYFFFFFSFRGREERFITAGFC